MLNFVVLKKLKEHNDEKENNSKPSNEDSFLKKYGHRSDEREKEDKINDDFEKKSPNKYNEIFFKKKLDDEISRKTANNEVLNDSQENKLNKYLKMNYLIGEKKIQQKVTKEEAKTNNVNQQQIVYLSDDEESLVNIIKDLEKPFIETTPLYYLNNEELKYRAEVRNKKKIKKKFMNLQNVKIKPNKNIISDTYVEENDHNMIEAQIDLDIHLKNLEDKKIKDEEKLKQTEQESCLLY